MRPLLPRSGPRPRTTPTNPHTQLDQQPTDPTIRMQLAARLFGLPDVEERPSLISVPGARALWLRDDAPASSPAAFLIGREFAHLHPGADQSLHAILPVDLAQEAIEAGWAELHPMARMGMIPPTTVMLYAPRDQAELDVIYELVLASSLCGRTVTPRWSGAWRDKTVKGAVHWDNTAETCPSSSPS